MTLDADWALVDYKPELGKRDLEERLAPATLEVGGKRYRVDEKNQYVEYMAGLFISLLREHSVSCSTTFASRARVSSMSFLCKKPQLSMEATSQKPLIQPTMIHTTVLVLRWALSLKATTVHGAQPSGICKAFFC